MFKPTMKAIAAGVCAASLTGCFQVQMFGPAAGASVTVAPLRDQGNVVYQATTWDPAYLSVLFGAQAWDGYDSLTRLLMMGIVLQPTTGIEPDTLYLVTATGGEDPDYDGNYVEDSIYTPLGSSIHAVMTGAELVAGNGFISPVTEIGYQWIKYNYEYHDDLTVLADLDYVATQFLDDANEDGSVDRLDMLSFNRMLEPAAYKWDISYLDNMTVAMAGGGTEFEIEDAAYEAIDGMSYHEPGTGGGDHDDGGDQDDDGDSGADDSANDHLESADYLGTFGGDFFLSYTGSLSAQDQRDFAYFTVTAPMSASIYMTPPADADFDLGTWLNGEHAAGSGQATGEQEYIYYLLEPGDDLYIETFQYTGEGDYLVELELKAR